MRTLLPSPPLLFYLTACSAWHSGVLWTNPTNAIRGLIVDCGDGIQVTIRPGPIGDTLGAIQGRNSMRVFTHRSDSRSFYMTVAQVFSQITEFLTAVLSSWCVPRYSH